MQGRVPAAPITLAVLACLWLAVRSAVAYRYALAGDAYAVYYPIVDGLWAGAGFDAFAPLLHGFARVPAYPVMLFLSSIVWKSMPGAAQLIGIGALAITLIALATLARRAEFAPTVTAVVVLFVGVNPAIHHAALESLPDAPFLALYVLILLAVVEGRSAWLVGVLVGVALLTRGNGIVLVPAIAILYLFEASRVRRLLGFFGGTFAALLPYAILILVARARGLPYPRARFADPNFDTTRGLGDVLVATLDSAVEVPERIHSVSGWTFLILGTLGLIVWAARAPMGRRVLFLTVSMLAILVPVHHEPRYVLFCLPVLGLGVLSLLDECVRRVPRARHAVWGAAAAVLLWVAVPMLSHWSDRQSELAAVGADWHALCLDGDATLGVFGRHQYSPLHGCPSFRFAEPHARVGSARVGDSGIDGLVVAPEFVSAALERGYERAIETDDRVLMRPPVQPTRTSTRARTLLATPWILPAPRFHETSEDGCIQNEFSLDPGRYVFSIEATVTSPLLGRLRIGDQYYQDLLVAGPERTEYVHRGPTLRLRFCPVDALRARGEIELSQITIERAQ